MRILKKFLCLLFFFPFVGFSQCPHSITLVNNTGNRCFDSLSKLTINNASGLSDLVWYKDDFSVHTSLSLDAEEIAIVAGNNGQGSALNQLNSPAGIFVDSSGNVYISDQLNQRVQKWAPGALTGITVAGGNGEGNASNQLDIPKGVYVDDTGNVFVVDYLNHRVQKWAPGALSGITVAGGNGQGSDSNQLSYPFGIAG